MRYQDFISPIEEGPHDPHIYKAVFMAGSPGSGKSTIANKLIQGTGLKYANIDKFYEWYLKQRKDVDFDRFQNLHDKEYNLFVQGGLGVMIDGTGRNQEKIKKIKDELEANGYSTMMIFVNTELETAIARASKRERKVDVEFLKQAHADSQRNIGSFQAMFGDDFVVVDNTGTPNLEYLEKRFRRFLNSPVRKKAA